MPHDAAQVNIESVTELTAYLRDEGRIGREESPGITVLRGGVSNRTVLVERAQGEAWVVKQALAKLRVAAEWFSSPERIHREALGLRELMALLPDGAVPRFLWEDRARQILAMEAIAPPHENWKTMLFRGEIRRAHVQQFGQLLRALHHRAAERAAALEPAFRDVSFFESLRLEPYYAYASNKNPSAVPFLRDLIAETRATRSTLVHGDYSPKNILVKMNRLILLDHEVIHWGDPAFDLGFSLALLLSKAHHLKPYRKEFMEAAKLYWQSYDDPAHERRVVRHTLACLLARVDGRSPLEYLNEDERRAQRAAALRLIASPPQAVEELTEQFVACL
jgi:aminoglycoside phosphotransferase (APT) family kinase protein